MDKIIEQKVNQEIFYELKNFTAKKNITRFFEDDDIVKEKNVCQILIEYLGLYENPNGTYTNTFMFKKCRNEKYYKEINLELTENNNLLISIQGRKKENDECINNIKEIIEIDDINNNNNDPTYANELMNLIKNVLETGRIEMVA